MNTRQAVGSGIALAGMTLISVIPAANATTASSSLITGHCTKGGSVTLQLQHSDPGVIESGFEVDGVRTGSHWRVKLTRNRVTYYSSTTAADRTHSFSIDRVLRAASTNIIVGVARNTLTGNVCSVRGTI